MHSHSRVIATSIRLSHSQIASTALSPPNKPPVLFSPQLNARRKLRDIEPNLTCLIQTSKPRNLVCRNGQKYQRPAMIAPQLENRSDQPQSSTIYPRKPSHTLYLVQSALQPLAIHILNFSGPTNQTSSTPRLHPQLPAKKRQNVGKHAWKARRHNTRKGREGAGGGGVASPQAWAIDRWSVEALTRLSRSLSFLWAKASWEGEGRSLAGDAAKKVGRDDRCLSKADDLRRKSRPGLGRKTTTLTARKSKSPRPSPLSPTSCLSHRKGSFLCNWFYSQNWD